MIKEDKVKQLLNDLNVNSNRVNRLVGGIIGDYIEDLDNYLEEIREKVKKGELSEQELELITIRLPTYIYFANERLEHLGVEGDVAGSMKNEAYDEKILKVEGTIPEKESQASLATLEEDIIEKAYKRAYKKLKSKIEKAENVYTGVKKIVDKRKAEITFNHSTSTVGQSGDQNE
jgi:hypothetical protein